MNRILFALVAFVVGSALAQSPEPAKIRITTWNLEWFANGSAREAPQEKQAQRIQAAADVLKRLNPDILLLQEVRDYNACARLGDAIQPGACIVSICSALKGGKQEEAILAKIPAQAAWSESWQWKELTRQEDSLLHGLRLESGHWRLLTAFEKQPGHARQCRNCRC